MEYLVSRCCRAKRSVIAARTATLLVRRSMGHTHLTFTHNFL